MAICDKKIDEGVGFDCDITGGVEANLYLFNREEITAYQRAVGNTQIIEDFVMQIITPAVPGDPGTPAVVAKGYLFEGYTNSVKPKIDGVVKTFGFGYNHLVDFLIFKRGSDVKATIEKMAMSRLGLVAVIEHLGKTTDATFEVLGTDVGLRLLAISDDPTNVDNGGAYSLQLASPNDFKEPHMPATFYDTDYATTKAALLALIAPNV